MWEIFTSGFIPYPGLQNNDVMTFVRKGGRLEIPAICPQSMYVLHRPLRDSISGHFFSLFRVPFAFTNMKATSFKHVPAWYYTFVYTRHFAMLEFHRYDLMCWCWQNDTVERPSFQTIYKFLVITHKVRVVWVFSILLTYRHVLIRPVVLGKVL